MATSIYRSTINKLGSAGKRNTPVAVLSMLHLDFKFENVNFWCSVINKAKAARHKNNGLQYKIWSPNQSNGSRIRWHSIKSILFNLPWEPQYSYLRKLTLGTNCGSLYCTTSIQNIFLSEIYSASFARNQHRSASTVDLHLKFPSLLSHINNNNKNWSVLTNFRKVPDIEFQRIHSEVLRLLQGNTDRHAKARRLMLDNFVTNAPNTDQYVFRITILNVPRIFKMSHENFRA